VEDAKTNQAKLLVEFARAKLDFAKIIEDYSRGGEYALLFLNTESKTDDGRRLLWANAWLASKEHISKAEGSTDHLQGRYIQEGFHPGYGTDQKGQYYETIYGGELEPLVLGWSADDKRIDPELSQEFERCYKLSRIEHEQRTVWNSWQESIDEVALLERHGQRGTSLIARTDFLRDFQYLRKRWLLLGVYGEWGKRTADGQHVWATDHDPKEHNLYLFGVPAESGFKYVEIQGYFLFPVPAEKGFSAGWGFGVPAGLKASVEKIEFQTSDGRVRPWEVREGKRRNELYGATATFDQEVLRRYQSEPGATVSLDGIGQLRITSRKVHLYRLAMLLGTEYVSVWLGDFVVGVPPAEWPYWQPFNVPFIGYERQNELFEGPNLFRMTANLIRLPKLIDLKWRWLTGDDDVPFYQSRDVEKEYESLSKALPRLADSHEVIDRAKALHALVIERIAETRLRIFLNSIGFAGAELEELGSIKLFSTFMMVVRIAELVEPWQDSFANALSYAQNKVAAWQAGAGKDLTPEELQIVEDTVKELEILFLAHDLRLLAAHPKGGKLEDSVTASFKNRIGLVVAIDQLRSAILQLYQRVSRCLEVCAH